MNETAIEIGKENALLRRLSQSADVEAFTEITRLYAQMVYGTCLRVTGDAHHAADAAQETYYQLLKNAGRITGSLGGWLHQVATRRAIDLVRRDAARRRREQEYVALASGTTDAWADISPLVDEALGELEPELADILVRHFLQRQTLSHIAAEKNVSQPTISRRVEHGVEQLRARLRTKGVLVPAAALGAMLASQTAEAVPAAVWSELGKIALTCSGAAAATGTLGVMNAKLAAAAMIAVGGIVGYLAYKSNPPDQPPPPSPQPTVALPAIPSARATPKFANIGSLAPAIPPATFPSAIPAVASTNPDPQDPANATLPSQGTNLVRGRRGTGSGWVMAPDGTRWSARNNPWPRTGTSDWMIQRFTFLLSQSDWQHLSACFVPGAKEATGLQRLLEDPQTEDERTVKRTLESLGLPAEVLETTPAATGVAVRWQAKVHKEFSILENGAPRLWHAGDWFELEAQLQQVGNVWKIARFGTSKE